MENLTKIDKEYIEMLLEKHCSNISFEKYFSSVLEKKYEYTENSLIEMYMVYSSIQTSLIDEYNKILNSSINIGLKSRASDLALQEIEQFSLILNLRLYKLTATFHKYLEILVQNPNFATECSTQEIKNLLIEIQKDIKISFNGITEHTNKKETLPKWRQGLIDKTLTYEDGKRVKKSLNDVACFIKKVTREPIEWKFLHKNFLQADGSVYSQKQCEKARDIANI
jgi:hypothetical protein